MRMARKANGNISRFKKRGRHDSLDEIPFSAEAFEKMRDGAGRGDAHQFAQQPYRRPHQAFVVLDDAQQLALAWGQLRGFNSSGHESHDTTLDMLRTIVRMNIFIV